MRAAEGQETLGASGEGGAEGGDKVRGSYSTRQSHSALFLEGWGRGLEQPRPWVLGRERTGWVHGQRTDSQHPAV